jgi:hypothetical protein
MVAIKIERIDYVPSYKQGVLKASYKDIVERLGFEPNVKDDPDKVTHSWAFKINGHKCAIWDWKGSSDKNMWSYYDPDVVLDLVFPTIALEDIT